MNNLNNNICYLQGLGILFFLSSVMACDPTPHLQKSQPTQPSTALDSEQGMGGIVAEDTSRKWLTFMLQEFKEGKISIHASHPGDNSGGTLLHYAACLGENKIVEDLLAQGANPNIEDTNKITPLQLLFIFQVMNPHLVEKQLEVVNTLLAQPVIEINKKELSGNTALHYAMSTGCLFTLNALLDHQRIDLNARNKEGQTPLHLAAKLGNLAIVKALLKCKKIDPNVRSRSGATPLLTATRSAGGNQLAIIDLLLTHGSNIYITDYGNNTILHEAIFEDVAILEHFLKQARVQVIINARNSDVHTPLHVAAQRGRVDILQCLLQQREVNIHDLDEELNTPLHVAAKWGHVEAVKLLLIQPGIKIQARNRDKKTPLDLAMEQGHIKIIQCFLNNALHHAAQQGNIEIVRSLLAQPGVDIQAPDAAGNTALLIAAINKHAAVLNFLLAQPGIDVNHQGQDGRALIHIVIRQGNLGVVNYLLESTNVNLELANNNGNTPLLTAIRSGGGNQLAIIKCLLKKGVNLYVQDSGHNTILHWAACGNIAVLNLLLEKPGLSAYALNKQNLQGETPLHCAAVQGHVAIAQRLLQEDINLHIENIFHQTPFYMALDKKHWRIARILLDRDMRVMGMRNLPDRYVHYDEFGLSNFLDLQLTQKGGSFGL